MGRKVDFHHENGAVTHLSSVGNVLILNPCKSGQLSSYVFINQLRNTTRCEVITGIISFYLQAKERLSAHFLRQLELLIFAQNVNMAYVSYNPLLRVRNCSPFTWKFTTSPLETNGKFVLKIFNRKFSCHLVSL